MAQRVVNNHQRYFPYPLTRADDKSNCLRGWPGPVFANERELGWIKLNAARACARCRARHVKCSLMTTGGPCKHCRKRKEVCEVLGWKLEPESSPKSIYKFVLPPPPIPISTPTHRDGSQLRPSGTGLDPRDLSQRLEQLSPRDLALLWAWGPNGLEAFYPSANQLTPGFHKNFNFSFPNQQPTQINSFWPNSAISSPSPSPSSEFGEQPNFFGQGLPMDVLYSNTSILSPSKSSDLSYSTCLFQDLNSGSLSSSSDYNNPTMNKLNRMSLEFILDWQETTSLTIEANEKEEFSRGGDSVIPTLQTPSCSKNQFQRPTLPSLRDFIKKACLDDLLN